MRWPDSPQPISNLNYSNTPLWLVKCIFLSQTNFHTFILNLPFSTSSSAFLFSFDLQPQNLLLFSNHVHPLSSTHDHGNGLFAIANWSMVSFKPNMNIKLIDLFLSLSCTPHIALTWIFMSFVKFPYIFLSGFTSIQYCWPYLTVMNNPFQL